MSNTPTVIITPSSRTDEIIGREIPLKAIEEAVKDEELRTWLLYFYGPGGVGKTRLLEEIANKGETLDVQNWRGLSFRSTPILDLYDSDFQSSEGIREGIAAGLKMYPNEFRHFEELNKNYKATLEEGASGQELRRLQKEVEDAFLEDYQAVAEKSRLVILLDTLELLQYESDSVQKICKVDEIDALVMNWLIQQLPMLPNTVILMAGRPENRERIENSFTKQFQASSNRFKAQPLAVFSPEETSAYLNAIASKLSGLGDTSLTEILAKHKEVPKNAHKITSGRPVYLALIIDLLLHRSTPGKILNYIIAGKSVPEDQLAKQLIENLGDLPEPIAGIVDLLFCARKGIDPHLLANIDKGNLDEEEAAERLKLMEKLAIVKVRTVRHGDEKKQRLFFHDEIYNMYDEYFQIDPRESEKYIPFANYYRQQQEESTTNEARQDLMINHLFYEMRVNPYDGYYLYYSRWDHYAIKGHEGDFDMRLRNEVLGFLNRYIEQYLPGQENGSRKKNPFYDSRLASKIDKKKVDRDCAIRWIRRHAARSATKIAREVAAELRVSRDSLFNWKSVNDPLYKADLLVATSEVMVQEATNVDKAVNLLKEAKDILEAIEYVALDKAEKWHYNLIRGLAENRLGYLYRTVGRYGLALRYYRLALHFFDQAAIESELATTLTNVSFLLALNSRTTEAKRHIKRAMQIREKSARKYLYALTLNTQGIITTLDNHPNWGVRDCREAFAILEKIEDPRGIGLATIGLGYSLRKQANQWKFDGCSPDEALDIFAEGKQVLDRAIKVFTNDYIEPMRKWEAYNELGSLFCDWAWLLRSQNEKEVALGYYDQSIAKQLEAIQIAENQNLEAQRLDTLDDLAQTYGDRSNLCFELGNDTEFAQNRAAAERYLDEIAGTMSEEFLLKEGKGFSQLEGAERHEGEIQWLAMGKQHLWRSIFQFRDVEYDRIDEEAKEEVLSQAMENLFIAIVYFRKYWPSSFDFDRAVGYLTDYLPKVGIGLSKALKKVEVTEQKYNYPMPVLRDLVQQTLLF